MAKPLPEILVTNPFPLLDKHDNFSLVAHRLWAEADQAAFLELHGARIRGLVAAGMRIDKALLSKLPNVEIIANFGVGYECVDVAEAARLAITVTNTPDVLTEEVADLAFGLLIATLRKLPHADQFVRNGKWRTGPFPLSATLRGRRVGIVGLGRIGKAVARRLEASRTAVAYHGRNRQPDVSFPYYPTVLALAEAVDTLILAAPGGAETHKIVDARVLSALGADGVLINIGRGSLVDEPALCTALAERSILGAGLDVFADEPKVPAALIASENVVLLPHIGSASVRTRQAMEQLVLDNLLSWFNREGPLTPVPETPWPRQRA